MNLASPDALKYKTSSRVTRRDFLLKYAPLGAVAAAQAVDALANWQNVGWATDWLAGRDKASWIERIDEYKIISPPFAMPNGMNHLFVNSPYIFIEGGGDVDRTGTNAQWDRFIDYAKVMGSQRVRMLAIWDIEPRIGFFNYNRLESLGNFARYLQEKTDDKMKLSVTLFDCFELGNCLRYNPVYGTGGVTSPYNPTRDWNGYSHFFTDPELRNRIKGRNRIVVRELLHAQKLTNIQNWTLMNEPLPRYAYDKNASVEQSTQELTEYYRDLIDDLRQYDPDTPILSGVVDPRHIDTSQIPGLTANTFHAYPLGINLHSLGEYLKSQNRTLPVEAEEGGFPVALEGHDLPSDVADGLFYNYIVDLIENTWNIDHTRRTIQPTFTSFGGWQISTEHTDGFRFTPDVLPRTIGLFEKLNNHVFLPLNT